MTTDKALKVLYEAAATDTGDLKKAVGILDDLIFGAEVFARSDPAVEWPSDKYHNAVEAIMAGWDDERERNAHAVTT